MFTVVVLYGGISTEREVSHKTGLSVAGALTRKGYIVHLLDTKNDKWIDALREIRPNAVFVALHGKLGEDGKIQGVLETLNIPYTGAGVRGSVISMDKLLSKYFFKMAGFQVPRFIAYDKDFHENKLSDIGLTYPLVVKPRFGGSTIGLHIVNNYNELQAAISSILQMGDIPLIEEFLEGRELTLGVYKNREGELVNLPLIEIVYESNVFDYQTKYTPGAAKHLIPAPVPDKVYIELKEKIPVVWSEMSLDGVVRFDFILKNERLYILEVNTIPGMTDVSLVPDAARYMGLQFDDLVEEVLLTASYGKP